MILWQYCFVHSGQTWLLLIIFALYMDAYLNSSFSFTAHSDHHDEAKSEVCHLLLPQHPSSFYRDGLSHGSTGPSARRQDCHQQVSESSDRVMSITRYQIFARRVSKRTNCQRSEGHVWEIRDQKTVPFQIRVCRAVQRHKSCEKVLLLSELS